MCNFDYITKEDIKDYNPNWSQITDHPYIISIAGGSWSLLNLMSQILRKFI